MPAMTARNLFPNTLPLRPPALRLTFHGEFWQDPNSRPEFAREPNPGTMKAALLSDRSVLRISGDPARHFLNNLVTSQIEMLAPGDARYAALLTPQGKIVADFLVVAAPESEGGFYIDCPAELAAELVQKLTFYRLRAKVTIEKSELAVLAIWDDDKTTQEPAARALLYRDPRLPALGLRLMIPPAAARDAAAELGATLVDAAEYDAHRIALGVPKGGVDFGYADAFPHDADLDKLHGVDFRKGCFVGQEVVSRVEHRGTARNRIVPIRFEGAAPPAGTAIMAGEKSVGIVGSSAGGLGLAMLRVDRAGEALSAGATLTAGGMALHLREGFADFIGKEAGKNASKAAE
jgi:folate-binding protein YgfZ